MTPKQIEQYHKSREKGFLRFLFIRGILMWSIPVGILVSIYKVFIEKESVNWEVMVFTWLIMGIIFGSITWHRERTVYTKNIALKDKQLSE